jgi:hypothetical protein
VEEDDATSPDQRRQTKVWLGSEDSLVRVLGLAPGDYFSVTVNSSWPEKGLLEGDVIMLSRAGSPASGDVVLIEEEGGAKLGIVSRPGFLETVYGRRPLEATERIIAVAVALARRTGNSER